MAFDNRMSSLLEIQNGHFWLYTTGKDTRVEGFAAFEFYPKDKNDKAVKSWVKPVKLC